MQDPRFTQHSNLLRIHEADYQCRWFKSNPDARSQIFLATKFGGMSIDNSPDYIRRSCHESLERLGTDHIDLYYCHRVDGKQPIEVTVRTMKELQDQGKVRHLGLSEVSASTLRRACKVAHIDAVQVEFSPFAMEPETQGLVAACEELGVALVAYSPLGRGFLTGSIKSPDDFQGDADFRRILPRFSPENFPKNLELVKHLQEIARQNNCTPSQLVLAWLLNYSEQIIPIPGTTKPANFDQNMAAAQISLSESTMGKIKAAIDGATVHGGRYPDSMSGALLADTVEE